MDDDQDAVLDQLQSAYKAAVDAWVTTIRAEEELASVHHSVAEVDKWENAHFLAEDARHTARAAKTAYENALRKLLFNI